MNGDPAYHAGMNDAQIRTLFEDIKEIKSEVKGIRLDVDGLKNYKAKVTGLSLGVSAVVSAAWAGLTQLWKHP